MASAVPHDLDLQLFLILEARGTPRATITAALLIDLVRPSLDTPTLREATTLASQEFPTAGMAPSNRDTSFQLFQLPLLWPSSLTDRLDLLRFSFPSYHRFKVVFFNSFSKLKIVQKIDCLFLFLINKWNICQFINVLLSDRKWMIVKYEPNVRTTSRGLFVQPISP